MKESPISLTKLEQYDKPISDKGSRAPSQRSRAKKKKPIKKVAKSLTKKDSQVSKLANALKKTIMKIESQAKQQQEMQ